MSFQGKILLIFALLSLSSLIHSAAFTPCPILGPSFPYPKLSLQSELLQSALADLTKQYDDMVKTGNSSHGTITPETTSFSIALFAGDGVDNDGDGIKEPFFYEYHYTAPALENSSVGVKKVDADSIYRIGGLTQLFTVLLTLIEAGDSLWSVPVTKLVPELARAASRLNAKRNPVKYVDWESVTVGHLTSHMAGIARDCESVLPPGAYPPTLPTSPKKDSRKWQRQRAIPTPNHNVIDRIKFVEFFDGFVHQAPVYLPGTTPVYSNAAFQILGYILEDRTGKSFEALLRSKIFKPLRMRHSSLFGPRDTKNGVVPGGAKKSGWETAFGGGAPAQSIFSTVSDLSKAGNAILSSSLISPAQTRRWNKPVSHTSNPANSVGRPWVIYRGGQYQQTVVVYVNTLLSSLGSYSSYIGIVPDFHVGFTILAADETGSPDLNAHADIIADALFPALMQLAPMQAMERFGGEYGQESSKSSITIAADRLRGIKEPSAVSIRLYPTDRETETRSGSRMAFRAVIQDLNEEADNGTPTCVSWMDVGVLTYGGAALDEVVFELGKNGKAVGLEVPALRASLVRLE
ncbi:hypothetical protein GX51_02859 [Blastomyces parvus]|uniref:Uncharacterized protein n=1 Tax=Blastomyces parvus TaxID=2060905 RepID=A0A2B7X9T0_9EURO|nr:hypothetical protein GX51_02859 [Blastomyces parvus]